MCVWCIEPIFRLTLAGPMRWRHLIGSMLAAKSWTVAKLFLHSSCFRPIQRDSNENHPLLRRFQYVGL